MRLNLIQCCINHSVFVYVLLVCVSRSASGYVAESYSENEQCHSTRTKRIVGGSGAKSGSWPWQVSLQFRWINDTSGTFYHYCGGSILNSFWIISVGHCKLGDDIGRKMMIYAGINHIGSYYLWVYKETVDRTNETLEDMNPFLQKLEPDKIFHWEHAHRNDGEVMLIKLKTPIEFNKHVLPVHLPESQSDYITSGLMCFATGWGTIKNRGRICPKRLQEIPIPLISLNTCKGWIDEVTDYKHTEVLDEYITSNMICAGYEEGGKSPCHADSGGPLVCCHEGRMELIGMTSWGINCAEPKNPTVFVFVPPFVDWIEQTMDQN